MSDEKTASPIPTTVAKEEEAKPVVPPKDRPSSPDDIPLEEPLEQDTPEATTITSAPISHAAVTDTEQDNAKPNRPMSEFDRGMATLIEAFPGTDVAVIKAVLIASSGKIEPAFVALLGMNDPNFVPEDAPPPKPPRPTGPIAGYSPIQTSTPSTQLEADELYARQLAEHYSGAGGYQQGTPQNRTGVPRQQRPVVNQRGNSNADEKERSFLDDLKEDIPELTENIKKGFFETQNKVSKWMVDFKKRLDGDEVEAAAASSSEAPGAQARRQQSYPQRQSSRRSGEGYDADPRVLNDDFSHLELRDNSGDPQTRTSNRPLPNPNLFDSDTTPNPRKVSFQNQSDEELYNAPPSSKTANPATASATTTTPTSAAPTGTSSKWAPLAQIEPTPLNNDPFSLGDSDDEHDAPVVMAPKTGPQESGTLGSTAPAAAKTSSPK